MLLSEILALGSTGPSGIIENSQVRTSKNSQNARRLGSFILIMQIIGLMLCFKPRLRTLNLKKTER
jgi:hypothetical protein